MHCPVCGGPILGAFFAPPKSPWHYCSKECARFGLIQHAIIALEINLEKIVQQLSGDA